MIALRRKEGITMPSWPIHLKIATKINKDDNFLLGNVLPDIYSGFIVENVSKNVDSKITHFREGKKINIECFLEKYKDKLDDKLVLGYLTHLLADEHYNEYVIRKYPHKDGCTIINNEMVQKKDLIKMKHHDLKIYDNKILKEMKFNIDFKNIKNTLNINDADLIKTIDYINSLKPYDDTEDYELFSEKELDMLYESCLKEIREYLKSSI